MRMAVVKSFVLHHSTDYILVLIFHNSADYILALIFYNSADYILALYFMIMHIIYL